MKDLGISAVLNVSHRRPSPDIVAAFDSVDFVPIYDFLKIKPKSLEKAFGILKVRLSGMLQPSLYIHCNAGLNRSPTVLWYFMIACGMDPAQARQQITSASRAALATYRKIPEPLLVTIRDLGTRLQLGSDLLERIEAVKD